jgi:hypothetical protein
MARETFIATADTLSAYQNVITLASVAMEERNPHRAHLALFNTTGSNQIVRIREISVSPLNLEGVTLNTVNLSKITAHNGGTSFTAFPLDTASAAFPSTVEIRGDVLSYTAVAENYAKVMLQQTSLLGVTVGYPFAKKNIMNRWMDATTAETQKITLRNGQGIALTEPNYPNTFNFPCIVNATIRLSDTGACYQLTAFVSSNNPALFTILNNGYTAGNVEILNLSIDAVQGGASVVANIDLIPYHNIALLEGYNPTNNGEVVTPNKLDSANTLNSYIKLYKNIDVGYFYARTGNLATNALMFRTIPQSQRFATPQLCPWKQIMFKSSGVENDIIVREGNGIAILQPDPGAYGSAYQVQITFTQESTSASAVFPAVGDVDLSVTYGPTGTDYTGTLQQPATTNVLSGVTYGAGGTEFTGTATGGGGGGVFIVNE